MSVFFFLCLIVRRVGRYAVISLYIFCNFFNFLQMCNL